MTNTSTYPLSIDGTRLDTLAYNVKTFAGRVKTPGVGTANLDVPQRHGSLWNPNKTYNDGSLALSMWVRGSDVDGNVTGDSMSQMRANLDALQLLFAKRYALLDVRQTWPSGDRQCFAEVIDVMDFSALPGPRRVADFSVGLDIPAVFWQDVNTVTAAGVAAGTSTIAALAGATAPMEQSVIVVRNPTGAAVANPRVTDVATGNYFQWNGSLAAGATITVDSGLWTMTGGSLSALVHVGSPRFLSITPAVGGPVLRLDGAGLTMDVTSRRKYLT